MSRSNRPAYARASRRSTKRRRPFRACAFFFFAIARSGGTGSTRGSPRGARASRRGTRGFRYLARRGETRATHRAGDLSGTRSGGRDRVARCGRGIERLRARAYLLAERRDAGDVVDVVEDAGAKGRLRERGHGVKHVRAGAQRHLFQRGGLLALAQVAPLTVATGLAGKRSAARARREGGRSCERGNLFLDVRRRARGGRSRFRKGRERTYLLCAFGELKHSGVGERAPASAVRCALPASPMP